MKVAVVVESGAKKSFARAVDWPGWARAGKTPELALQALQASAGRYAVVAEKAGEPFDPNAYEIVDEVSGGGGTDFGVPSVVTDLDRRPTDRAEADRLVRLVDAAWTTLDHITAAAPAELRKGPRGGGRDRDKMVAHVIEAEGAYAREMGIRLKRQPDPADPAAVDLMRSAMLDILREPSDGLPLAGRKWTARYAAGRIAWHAVDHAWEMEDRSEPG
ncbi:MAG: hypothetical protein ACJ77X_06725 [Chloroflexota bacterium]